jgi:predicted TIM-barrel fold metal-dependent hydrolase
MLKARIEDAKKNNVRLAKTIVMVGYRDRDSAFALKELQELAESVKPEFKAGVEQVIAQTKKEYEEFNTLLENPENNVDIMVAYKDDKDVPYILPKLGDINSTKSKCLLDNKQNLIKIHSLLNEPNVHVRFSGYLDLSQQLRNTSSRKVKSAMGLSAVIASYFVNHRLKSLEKQGRISAEGVNAKQKNLQAE